MNVISYFADCVLPYFAIPIFIIGSVWRVWRWSSRPVPLRIGLVPAPKTEWGRLRGIVTELVFLPAMYSSQRILWVIYVPFQMVIGFLLLDYALRFAYGVLLYWQVYIPVVDDILDILRFSAPALVILTLLMFTHRLGRFEVRRLSIPSDYAVLCVVLVVASLASLNNFVAPTPLEYIGRWIVGLVTLSPAPVRELAFSGNILALQIMLMFFPFSKMRDPLGQPLCRMFTVKEELLHPEGVVVK